MLTLLNQEGFLFMNIVSEINQWIEIRKTLTNKSIGFVPTMGNLHDGHLSLCKKSQNDNDITVVSIFVNGTQFNNKEDLINYPRTLEADIELLKSINVDYLFYPSYEAMYPDDYAVRVMEIEESKVLEGAFRPGHFDGVLTIVLKLFNLVQPQKAYFGEKDYQQLLLVKKMVAALFLPIEIIQGETVRDKDGLALSSRNSRLTEHERSLAPKLYHHLSSACTDDMVIEKLKKLGFDVEYITKKWERRLVAAKLGNVRLIDNINIS